LTLTLENTSEPIPKELACEMVRFRNLGKIGGCSWAYDDVFIGGNTKLGIEALKEFQKSIKLFRVIPQIPKWWIENRVSTIFFNDSIFPFDNMPGFLYVIKQEKQFAAEVLLENCVDELCRKEGFLLQNESYKWEEFYNLYDKYVNMLRDKGLVKTVLFSLPLFIKMDKVLDDITYIEKMILNNK